MSRAHKKISRSLEERSILASTDHVSQMSQTDNELRQKLEAINTSHRLSNKRIRQETRELKKILRDLQKELKVSKGTHGQYIPSLLEQPQGRVRRTTVSSVPVEDRKEAARDQQGQVKKGLNHDFTRRRRSGSFPPSLYADLKKSPQLYSSEPAQHDGENHTTQPNPDEELNNVEQVSLCRQPKNEGKAAGLASQVRASNQELPIKRPPHEQQQGEKKYLATKVSQPFSKAVCGKFATKEDVIISCSSRTLYQSPQTQQLLEGSRETPSIVDEYSVKSNQNEQRKKRLSEFHHSLQRKRSIGSKHRETVTALQGQFDIHDPVYAFDSLPEIIGGRRLSVTHGRVRKTSRTKGLPTLKEEKTEPTSERKTAEMWSDLANCRYLRKEEKEISMDDKFEKD